MSSGASSESFSGSPSGALHTAVLDAVADRLRELDDLLRDADPGHDRRVFTALRELECHFDGLRADAGRFTAELRRLLRPGTPAPDGPPAGAAVTYLQETVTYLQEYATGLDQRWDAIKQALESVARHGVNVLHTRALAGANLPPSRAEVSSSRGGLAPSPSLPGQDPVAAWLEERAVRWEALRAWFAEDGGARRLHDVAREAVVALLESLDRIADARRRPAGAAADFRALARWFATAPTEDDAHRLWDAAFGLAPARHAHLGHADAELVPAGVPWARAEPVEVSALLRSRGRTERVGRTGKVRDVTALRAERRARAARERAALETAWSSLATTISGATPAHGGGRTSAGPGEPAASGTGAMRLSRLGELDHAGLARLLDLIGRALAERPDAAGFRRAATADGRIEIVLRDPEDGAVAELRTPEGSFLGPDYLIDLHAAGGHGCETTPAPHSRAVGA